MRWVETLRRSTNASTYRLAHIILIEAFKQEQIGGEIVLSVQVTGMHRNARARAVAELVQMGLIRVRQEGREAVRVLYIKR